MRLLPFLGAFIFFAVGGARAQEDAPLPKADTQDAQPAASPSTIPQLLPPIPLPSDTFSPPPALPSMSTITQLDEALKLNPVNQSAATTRYHQEWRELRNQVVTDPELRRLLAEADAARTDLEKRKRLEKYYGLYFDKMSSLAAAPELKAYLTARKAEQLAAFPQPRVRPTPTPSPSPTPKPAPKP